MPPVRGKPLCPQEKNLLVSVKHYFDRNKSDFGCKESSAQMTADALGLGLATVNRVMAAYRKDPKSLDALPQRRARPAYSIEASHQEAVISLPITLIAATLADTRAQTCLNTRLPRP
jgi:hypothetical protein